MLPPNTVEFDELCDGRLTEPKTRGRTGPRAPSFAEGTGMSPTSELLFAAVTGLIASQTNQSCAIPCTPTKPLHIQLPPSPMPSKRSEIRASLSDFASAKGVDFTGFENELKDLDFTPDVVPAVAVARLQEVFNATEGQVIKYQMFCREWNTRLEEKRKYS
jgi:hypothetical protein